MARINVPSEKLPSENLKVEALRKRIADVAGEFLLEADFEIRSGERAALIGPSGSGKTTLLRLIAGLELANGEGESGRIWMGSEEVSSLPPQKRGVGVVFQDQALFPALDVLENVTFGLRMRGVPKGERDAEGMRWLEKVGLKKKARASVNYLSGGEAQRVAFARALIWKPRVLLLDEPFSALDTDLRESLRRELVELHQLWPVPLVLVSHDRADLEAVATLKLEMRLDPNSEVRRVLRS